MVRINQYVHKNVRYIIASAMSLLLVALPACQEQPEVVIDKILFDINKLQGLQNVVPVAIIGTGPAGQAASVYVGRAHLKGIQFEGELPGGLLTQTTEVENWPGSIDITGPDIIKGLRAQVAKWGVKTIYETVDTIDTKSWPYTITTREGTVYRALTIIIATGATPLKLGIPGETEFWGKGVTTCAICDAPFHKDQEVVVVGGGDSAVEETLQLAPYAKKITILVRKGAMRASAAMQERIKNNEKIVVKYFVQVKEIHGEGDNVTGVTLVHEDGKTEHMPTHGVFLAIGHAPNTKFLKDVVELDPQGYIYLADRTQQTSVPGIFAAGDVADSRYRQAGVSSGHGIAAALDATFLLNDIGFNEQVQKELEAAGVLYQTVAKKAFKVPEINDLAALNARIAKGPAIIDFYAEWCPSCMQMLPAFSAVAQEFDEHVACIKVDADQAEEIMKAYKIAKVPALLACKDGAVVERFTKTLSKTELQELAHRLLQKA
jgi:thioredoxin reductase (NADPH)